MSYVRNYQFYLGGTEAATGWRLSRTYTINTLLRTKWPMMMPGHQAETCLMTGRVVLCRILGRDQLGRPSPVKSNAKVKSLIGNRSDLTMHDRSASASARFLMSHAISKRRSKLVSGGRPGDHLLWEPLLMNDVFQQNLKSHQMHLLYFRCL